MPNPSTVSAQDVSTELGKSTTTPLELNWANTRNVAVKSSGEISYGDCRWGINFPGGSIIYSSLDPSGAGYGKNYDLNANLDLSGYATGFGSQIAYCNVLVHSNGTLELRAAGGDVVVETRTWLTSGVNTDYTAQLILYDSAAGIGPSASNTDLALSTTRHWSIISASGGGTASNYANSRLVIKSAGTTLINRAVNFTAFAEAY